MENRLSVDFWMEIVARVFGRCYAPRRSRGHLECFQGVKCGFILR